MMEWKAFFAGDVTMASDTGASWLAPGLRRFIASHDVAACNFEGALRSGAPPVRKAGPHVDQCPESAQRVIEAGFGVINLANNHIMDYGVAGVNATKSAFAGSAACLGADTDPGEAYAPLFLDVKGVRIGLLAFCESEFGASRDPDEAGFAWINHDRVDGLIVGVRARCDVLIVQAHAGIEQEDVPLPEWRDRYRRLLDAGADAVIGHHPHQPQGWESHGGKTIVYSLGNFFFQPEYDCPWRKRGAIASLVFEGSSLVRVDILPIRWTDAGVDISPDQEDAAELERLRCALDEPAYGKYVNAMADRLWRDRYRHYYLQAANGIDADTGMARLAKILLKKLVVPKRSGMDEALLLHNLGIESHRWLVERALRRSLKA